MKIQKNIMTRSIRIWIPLLLLMIGSMATFVSHAESNYKKKPIRVLLVGGGASHDFNRWYKEADVQTLQKDGLATVTYIDDVNQILSHLKDADVLYLTNNQPIQDAETRKAIFEFAAAGKGLVLGHAALWYNWKDWPEYNLQLVSGGSRGHDAYGSFNVTILNSKHPVTKGVPKKFTLKDELYYYKQDTAGPGIEILANAAKEGSDVSYPSVFVVKHPQTRIVAIALGHDGESHDFSPYQQILRNAVKWVAGK